MIHGSGNHGYVSFLNRLSEAVRTDFERLGERRRFVRGDILISEGDPDHDLMLLHEGVVKVTIRLNGQESLMDIKIEGEAVGELAAMDHRPRSATVTACGDVTATVVPQHTLRAFLNATPEAAPALGAFVSGRARRADRRLLEFRGYPVKVRLARVLVELATSYGCRAAVTEFA